MEIHFNDLRRKGSSTSHTLHGKVIKSFTPRSFLHLLFRVELHLKFELDLFEVLELHGT